MDFGRRERSSQTRLCWEGPLRPAVEGFHSVKLSRERLVKGNCTIRVLREEVSRRLAGHINE